MLLNLHVQNLALIDDIEMDFGSGLNVFTGETGAGKSMLIGSVLLALGKKADKNIIRNGKEYCLVELTFQLTNSVQIQKIKDMELEIEDGNIITISRKITNTRSQARVGGESVTASQLAEITSVLIDVYGQNEHQSLVKPASQLEILDRYCGEEAEQLLDEVKEALDLYKKSLKELEAKKMDEGELSKKQDFLAFEIDQIESANLRFGEDEELESQFDRMSHGEKIISAVGDAHEILSGGNNSLLDGIGRAIRELSQVSQYDQQIDDYVNQLSQIEDLMTGASKDMNVFLSEIDYSEEAYFETEKRLNLINDLKQRYGRSIEVILEELEAKKKEAESLADYENYILKLENQLKTNREKLYNACDRLNKLRNQKAISFAAAMEEALKELNFNDIRFQVDVVSNIERITSKGWDSVTFLVSTNIGEPIKPLSDVASGGELSRMMLGLKTLMADSGVVDTLVFDEIDTGISGRTAAKVASKLRKLSGEHQILCITHLPQIAAAGDIHFLIEKEVFDGKTKTDIRKLNEETAIEELARMVGSDVISPEAIENAKALKAGFIN